MVSVVLSTTLVPSISKAEVPTCFGQPATIVGSDRSEYLYGTEGPDVIVGLGGRDHIEGLGGDDVICGHAADDRLFGGPGNDQVKGGEGDDSFGGYLEASDEGNDRLLGDQEKTRSS
jgi:Ca2+-binding RTX toxin-like protein